MIRCRQLFIVLMVLTAITTMYVVNAIAYSHDNAHIEINALAFAQFGYDVAHDLHGKYKKFRNYDFKKDIYKLEGYGIAGPDNFEIEEKLVTGNYQFWIAYGGYTADEPEILSSLRHFYDPLSLQVDKTTGKRVAYLTDHVSDLLDTLGRKAIVDPQMDAREWALTGPARRGYGENRYSLRRGLEYMRRAWEEKSLKMKDRLYAAAWRACGETMHLLADMTVPAHVRNDAHPFNTLFSGLRMDPYENYVTSSNPRHGSVIKANYNKPVPKGIARAIESSKDAFALFHTVALFTNQFFFSADTLTGINANGEAVSSANGMRDYPSPSLGRAKLDALGVYKDTRTGVSIAHGDWAENTWWNTKNYLKQGLGNNISASSRAMDSYEDVAMDQAKILIPVAITANKKLLEMIIPEIEIELTGWDPDGRILTGKITHKLSGVWSDAKLYPGQRPLVFNKGSESWSMLRVNNKPQVESIGDYELEIEDSFITVRFSDKIDLKLNGKNTFSLELFFGGFWVSSDEYNFEHKVEKRSVSKSVRLSGQIPHGNATGRLDVTFQKARELSMGGRYTIEDFAYQVDTSASISAEVVGGSEAKVEQHGNLSASVYVQTDEPIKLRIQASAQLKDSGRKTFQSQSFGGPLYTYQPELKGYLLKGADSEGIFSRSGSFNVTVNQSVSCQIYALVGTSGSAKIPDLYKRLDPVEIPFSKDKTSEIPLGTVSIKFNESKKSETVGGANPFGGIRNP